MERAGRFSRYLTRGRAAISVVGALAVCSLVLVPSGAAAKTPLYVWRPPFLGATEFNYTSSYTGSHCGVTAGAPIAPFFNTSTGRLAAELNTTAREGTCNADLDPAVYTDVGIEGPVVNLTSWGLHVLRLNWKFHYNATLTVHSSGNPGSGSTDAYALFSFTIDLDLCDNTTGTCSASSGPVYSAQGQITTGDRIVSSSWDARMTMPIPVVLSRGHGYYWAVIVTAEVEAFAAAGGASNAATAQLNFGLPGNESRLTEIVIH